MENQAIILVDRRNDDAYEYRPGHIVIEGLAVGGCRDSAAFATASGDTMSYGTFVSPVRIQTGEHVALRNNELYDSNIGLITISTDDGPAQTTESILVQGNYFHDNGVVGDDRRHSVYTQSMGITFQFNYFGPLAAGARGSNVKDRSGGVVIRYNYFVGGARALDLVDAEDFPRTAVSDGRYRTTYVYGNLIRNSDSGRLVHYGGDTTVYDVYRKGTLYFYSNTVVLEGSLYQTSIFQLDTNDERAEIFNNVFVLHPQASTRIVLGCDAGVHNLGVNWMPEGWLPGSTADFGGTVTGQTNVIVGTDPPVDMQTLVPLASSTAIDAGRPPLSATASHPVEYQWDIATGTSVRRVLRGAAGDLGGIERP